MKLAKPDHSLPSSSTPQVFPQFRDISRETNEKQQEEKFLFLKRHSHNLVSFGQVPSVLGCFHWPELLSLMVKPQQNLGKIPKTKKEERGSDSPGLRNDGAVDSLGWKMQWQLLGFFSDLAKVVKHEESLKVQFCCQSLHSNPGGSLGQWMVSLPRRLSQL